VSVARRDRSLVWVNAFSRATATGLLGVHLGVYFARSGFSPADAGTIVSAGLAGTAAAAFAATLFADRHGRRRLLVEVALLGVAGSTLVALGSHVATLAAAAFFGMLNGMGRDRGASLIVEQAILPATTSDRERTRVFAWYNVLQDAGHALGSLLAGLPALAAGTAMGASRLPFAVYAGLLIVVAAASSRLSAEVERTPPHEPRRMPPATRKLLTRISLLFSVDSLGGGFLTTALLSYFFFERFGAGEGVIALLFFGARVLNAASHLGAAWLARRIGLVNTMVWTHVPSSVLLVTVAFAPSLTVAAVLFLIREGLVEMDVPTRQSYVMAVVEPEDRTTASGVTNLVRLSAWAVAPALAGWMMGSVSLLAPLLVAAALKIAYDFALYFAFRSVRPPEEAGAAS